VALSGSIGPRYTSVMRIAVGSDHAGFDLKVAVAKHLVEAGHQVVDDVTTASLARRHNDANVICMGGRTLGWVEAIDAVDTFFTTEFEGGRHQRRIDEITAFESARRLEDAAPA
jgi:ribose 5-phosphate isomerase RpiB